MVVNNDEEKKYMWGAHDHTTHPLFEPTMSSHLAQRQKAAAARAARYVRAQSKAGGAVTLPRRVTAECSHSGQKAAPHYLVYLTQEEIALVLALTAHSPSGVTGKGKAKGILCADPGGPPTGGIIAAGPRCEAGSAIVPPACRYPVEGYVEDKSDTWGWRATPVKPGDDRELLNKKGYFEDYEAMGTITHYLPEGWDGDKKDPAARVWYYRLDGEEDEAEGFEFDERMLWESDEKDMTKLQEALDEAERMANEAERIARKAEKKARLLRGVVPGSRTMFLPDGTRRERGAIEGHEELHVKKVNQRRRGSSSATHRGLGREKGDRDPFAPGDYVYYAYPEEDPDTGEMTRTWHAAIVQKATQNDDPGYKRYAGNALVAANQRVTAIPLADENSWTRTNKDDRSKPAKVKINDFTGDGFYRKTITPGETYLRVFTNDMSGTDEDPAGFAIKHMERAPPAAGGAGWIPRLLKTEVGAAELNCRDLEAATGGLENYLISQRIFSKDQFETGYKADINGIERELTADEKAAGQCVFYGPGAKTNLDRVYSVEELMEIRERQEEAKEDVKAGRKEDRKLTIDEAEALYKEKKKEQATERAKEAKRQAKLEKIDNIEDEAERANALLAKAERDQAQAEAAAAKAAIDTAQINRLKAMTAGADDEEDQDDVDAVRAMVKAQLIALGADADAILADFDEADADGEYVNDEDRIIGLQDLVTMARRRKTKSLFETAEEDP